MKITAIVLTKNEEKNIEKCLKHLNWCNETIVIDDYSDDKTREIAKDTRAKVFKHKLNNNFAAQRNFGLIQANNPWVLFVDADEIVSEKLADEIKKKINKTKADGFYIPRKEHFLGKPIKCADKPAKNWSWGPNKLLRLGKKSSGKWEGEVHEKWQIKGEVKTLKNALYHKSFTSLSQALLKINLYSSIQAEELYKNNKKTSLIQIILFPTAKFFKDFFWHQGFLDQTRGLIYCLIMSLHSFLVRAKLWHKREAN